MGNIRQDIDTQKVLALLTLSNPELCSCPSRKGHISLKKLWIFSVFDLQRGDIEIYKIK